MHKTLLLTFIVICFNNIGSLVPDNFNRRDHGGEIQYSVRKEGNAENYNQDPASESRTEHKQYSEHSGYYGKAEYQPPCAYSEPLGLKRYLYFEKRVCQNVKTERNADKRHKTFRIYFGKPIPWQTFDNSKKPAEWAEWIKNKVYKLKD